MKRITTPRHVTTPSTHIDLKYNCDFPYATGADHLAYIKTTLFDREYIWQGNEYQTVVLVASKDSHNPTTVVVVGSGYVKRADVKVIHMLMKQQGWALNVTFFAMHAVADELPNAGYVDAFTTDRVALGM